MSTLTEDNQGSNSPKIFTPNILISMVTTMNIATQTPGLTVSLETQYYKTQYYKISATAVI